MTSTMTLTVKPIQTARAASCLPWFSDSTSVAKKILE